MPKLLGLRVGDFHLYIRPLRRLPRVFCTKSTYFESGSSLANVVLANKNLVLAAWVDRADGGWIDRLGDLAEGGPTIIVKGVDEAVDAIKKWRSPNA